MTHIATLIDRFSLLPGIILNVLTKVYIWFYDVLCFRLLPQQNQRTILQQPPPLIKPNTNKTTPATWLTCHTDPSPCRPISHTMTFCCWWSVFKIIVVVVLLFSCFQCEKIIKNISLLFWEQIKLAKFIN